MADPVTLGALAIGALVGGGTAYVASHAGQQANPTAPATPEAAAAPTPPPPSPAAPTSRPAAAPATNPVGSAQANRNTTPTFIGAAAAPENRQFGQRTLLGQ